MTPTTRLRETMDDHSRTEHGGNVDAFSTAEETTQAREQVDDGLFPQEREIVNEYFSAGESVLDIGCGAGRTTVQLVDAGLDVVAVDVSEPMVEAARSQTGDTALGIADATQLPFAENSFDNVLFSYNGLDYPYPAGERWRALSEIRRVLNPNGTFAFSSHNTWYKIPALVSDWEFLRKFHLGPENKDRNFRRYKIDSHESTALETYFSNPFHQLRQLHRIGFRLETVIGKRDSLLRFFERGPYYVARPV